MREGTQTDSTETYVVGSHPVPRKLRVIHTGNEPSLQSQDAIRIAESSPHPDSFLAQRVLTFAPIFVHATNSPPPGMAGFGYYGR